MAATVHPLILYVPGLLPKPPPEAHKDALLRCLLAGLRRVDEAVAEAVAAEPARFDIVAWTYDFYREHRDMGIDSDAIDEVIRQSAATRRDIAEASSWKRGLTRWIYHLGDRLPFLIPHIASERTEVHLRDLRRYLSDDNGIAEHTRRMLKVALKAATEAHRPILLIGHSMGSVIAYDALWELSHEDREPDHVQIDLLLTMGSPLGQRYLQQRIKGSGLRGKDRYPLNIRHWQNLAAVGDLTAIDPYLKNDFGGMLGLQLVESFEDHVLYNYFRLDGELNVHAEYGYLANDTTAHTVSAWWRRHDPALSSP